MKKGVIVLVGTKKGAYVLRADPSRRRWRREGPLFPGEPVYHLAFDHRDGRTIWAACNQLWGGAKIRRSDDLGRTWNVVSNPAFDGASGLTLSRIWHVEPGHASQPDAVWAGVEPAGLFRTTDRGERWESIAGLNGHPSREHWEEGGGGLALHSIAIDAADGRSMAVGISTGGVFASRDGGVTWSPWNEGSRAGHLPEQYPAVGQCVHKVLAHPDRAGEWFQRGHFGVYWRESRDDAWSETTDGLPTDFGFAGALHPHDAATAYVIPLDPMIRLSPPPSVAVYATRDRGRTWRRLGRGIPRGATAEVMREGLSTDRLDPAGLYFGTIAGDVWASPDEGRTWTLITEYLPPVLSVSTATLI